MDHETTLQTSCSRGNHQADECQENIPPGVTAVAGTSKVNVQVGDVVGCSTAQPRGGNEPVSDTCTFSTPAPTNSDGVKAKSRLSGLQSALTPILKYLNISNKRPSPEPSRKESHSHSTVPPFSFGLTTANGQKPTGSSSQHPNSDLPSYNSGQSLSETNPPARWLFDEYLPDITLLDVTCDCTMQLTRNDSALPDSVPTTPVKPGAPNSTFTTLQASQLSASTAAQIPFPQKRTLGVLQSNVNSPKVEGEAADQASSIPKDATERSRGMNQNSSADGALGSCDGQNVTFDSHFHSLSKQNGTKITSETNPGDQSTLDKTCSSKISNASTSAKENNAQVHPPQLSNHNETTASPVPIAKLLGRSAQRRRDAPLCWLDDSNFPEITLLDVTRDSEASPGGEISSTEVTWGISPVATLQNDMPSSELSENTTAEPGTLDVIQGGDLSGTLDGNVTHTISSFSEQSNKCVGENLTKHSLEATRDISMGSTLEDSRPSLETSGQNMVKIQTSAEDTHPANVTRDLSSSSDMSVQCAASQFHTSNTQCNTTSKNITIEIHSDPVEDSNTVKANDEEQPISNDAELTSKVPQTSTKTTGSVNGTFNIVKHTNLSASANLNTIAETSSLQNQTLDLPPFNVNSPKVESDAKGRAASVCKNTMEMSPVINQNCSAGKASGSCDVQNTTFDKDPLRKSSSNSTLGETGTKSFSLQNNTFDSKPQSKQNGTITLSETSSSDSHQNTVDKPSPTKVSNSTSGLKDNNSEIHRHELSRHDETTASTNSNANMADTPGSTFEANPAVEVAPGAAPPETKDHSGLPLRDGLSDTLDHQSLDTENNNNNASAFNLDDTLDLRADYLITSTPMTNCKMFNYNIERDEGKILAAQKKLYGEGPPKPDPPAPSDVPPNIVCDRKTFLTQPAAKSLLPSSKAPSQFLKYKPASILPGRFDPLASGLPMTRQRTQAEALRNTAASESPQVTTGISNPYNLRTKTTGLTLGFKQPNSSLRKPQLSGIPSGIQRAASGLRAPSARSNAPAASGTDKLSGPTATNPAAKLSQAKKHPLVRGEALPVAKRKKIDAPLPPASAEASASTSDSANRAKTLKQPAPSQRALPAKTQRDDAAVPASTAETSNSCDAVSRARALKQPANSHRGPLAKPQGHGCPKCVVLEQQLKMKSEEIRRLREELLKYSKQEEKC